MVMAEAQRAKPNHASTLGPLAVVYLLRLHRPKPAHVVKFMSKGQAKGLHRRFCKFTWQRAQCIILIQGRTKD